MKKKHILLAEDESHARTSIAMALRKYGFEVSTTPDGSQTLDTLQRAQNSPSPIDMLITDIQMPGMNGVELIDRLRKLDIQIPILVITGFGNKELVVQLIRREVNDFIDKPFEPEELLKSINGILAKWDSRHLAQIQKEQEMENKTSAAVREAEALKQNMRNLSQQVDSAVDAYRNLIPLTVPSCKIGTAFRFKPLSRLGGDYFDIRDTPTGCRILIADIAGHDLGSSFHAIFLRAFMDEYAGQPIPLPELFRLLNRQLIKSQNVERMITAQYLDFNLLEMRLEAVSAGHPPFLEIKRNAPVAPSPLLFNNPVLGMFDDIAFYSFSQSLQPGDRFLFYTDGVTSAQRIQGNTGLVFKLSLNGLITLLTANRDHELDDLVQIVWSGLLDFCRHKPNDDMLLLGVEIPFPSDFQ